MEKMTRKQAMAVLGVTYAQLRRLTYTGQLMVYRDLPGRPDLLNARQVRNFVLAKS